MDLSLPECRVSSFHSQHLLECCEATRVFLRCADGDANPFRQLVAAHRARDDAELLQSVEDALTVADAYEDEVCVRKDKFEFKLAEGVLQELQAACVVGSSSREMILVFQSGEGAGLGDRVDIERLPHLFQSSDKVRIPDAVTQAQS